MILRQAGPERSCGICTLCCKVLSITELNKPQNVWCSNCDIGRGCRIYETKPIECTAFNCLYLDWPEVEEHWFPARCKMVIVPELEGMRIAIHVDPSRPNAWREEPFYSDIQDWACSGAPETIQVVVYIKNRAIVVLPDREVDLGQVGPDQRIITVQRGDGTWDALKLQADDPRLVGMLPGKPFRRIWKGQ